MKAVMCGLLVLCAGTPADAAEHYTEVWNPPEARGGLQHIHPAHKPSKHRHASLHMAHAKVHRRLVATAPPPRTHIESTASGGTTQPSFDDIPRQITPEGNVLRVDGGRARVEVAR